MKKVTCHCCGTEVPLKKHPGLLLNELASLGAQVVSLKDQISRLSGSNKVMASLRQPLEESLTKLEAHLEARKAFRDAPENDDAD